MTSIRLRLTRHRLVVILLLEALGATALFIAAREAANDAFDESLDAKALAISTLTTIGPTGVRVTFSDHFFRGFDDKKPRDYFEIWDAADHAVARSESFPEGELPQRLGSVKHPVHWNLQLPDGTHARGAGFTFEPKIVGPHRDQDGAGPAKQGKFGGPPSGYRPILKLVVATRSSELEETLWQLFAIAFATAAFLFGGTLLVVPGVLKRGLMPLDRLGEQVTRIDADSLGAGLATENLPAELKPIGDRLNELLARLQRSFERERRFSADLAHELRTPVAELKSAAECALKWPDDRDPQTDRDVLAIANQMEAMVTHMLALARGEERKGPKVLTPIALAPEIESVWSKVDVQAKERGLNPILALEPFTVPGDPALLRSILVNLFDNAVDYATAPGSVEIVLEQDDHATRLKVSNSAVDLKKENLPQLFDRFWRRDEARSGGRHLGLGLPLARELAASQGWALNADLRADQWLTFTLEIPRPYAPVLAEEAVGR
jgi:two-component system sensor histidine kinase QseC